MIQAQEATLKHLMHKTALALLLVLMLAAVALPVLAASQTTTITESQINSNWRMTNPWGQRVTSKSADLQPGQLVITVASTDRRGEARSTVSTLVPSISNGRLNWTVSSLTVNGEEVAASTRDAINNAIVNSLGRYFKGQTPGRVTAVEITDTELLITYESRR